MTKLLSAQQEASFAKNRLSKAKADLALFQAAEKEHIKKVLMTFAGGSQTALMKAVLSGWCAQAKQMKKERLIYEEYRVRIEVAEQRLIAAKVESLKSVMH